MASHQAQQPPVLAAFGVHVLPGLEKVLVHQADDVEAIGDDGGPGEVLPGDVAVGLGQVHDDEPDVVLLGAWFDVLLFDVVDILRDMPFDFGDELRTLRPFGFVELHD